MQRSATSSDCAGANVFDIRTGRPLAAPAEAWSVAVEERLQELIRLPVGWDGYNGQPVSFRNAVFALSVLESTCTIATPSPEVVPGSSGDLQLEWHLPGGEIELHIRAPNDVHAWRYVPGNPPRDEELLLSTDFSVVAQWIRELTEAPLAAHAAAV